MSEATQIGWYTLKEDEIFCNTFECAAWYEKVLVKAGRYPVMVYDFRIKRNDSKYIRCIEGHIGGVYVHMEGTIVSDNFGGLYFGVPIGCYDTSKNAGKPSSHSTFAYMYSVADSILNDVESPWELFPAFEARKVCYEWNGNPYTTHSIYANDKLLSLIDRAIAHNKCINDYINITLRNFFGGDKITPSQWFEANELIRQQNFYEKGCAILDEIRALGIDCKIDMQSNKLHYPALSIIAY